MACSIYFVVTRNVLLSLGVWGPWYSSFSLGEILYCMKDQIIWRFSYFVQSIQQAPNHRIAAIEVVTGSEHEACVDPCGVCALYSIHGKRLTFTNIELRIQMASLFP